MTTRRRRIKTDPKLQRQLEAAKDSDQRVEAVLTLRDQRLKAADPKAVTRAVLKRVEDEVGVGPEVVNILGNLGVVVVAAQEPFVSSLLCQPEFSSAMANSDLDDDDVGLPTDAQSRGSL